VDGATTKGSSATSGVPQGSTLGPLFFVVFFNDLPDIVEARTGTALYADDTKLHKTITVIVIVRLYNTPYPILIYGLWKTTSASTSLSAKFSPSLERKILSFMTTLLGAKT
jgi:hypothetical protein